jgi:hypothetical protein
MRTSRALAAAVLDSRPRSNSLLSAQRGSLSSKPIMRDMQEYRFRVPPGLFHEGSA